MKTIKTLKKTAENLRRLFDVILKISTNDYRIVISERLGPMIDVYFRDEPFGKYHDRKDLIIALQTIEYLLPDYRISFHYCLSKHEQFDGRVK